MAIDKSLAIDFISGKPASAAPVAVQPDVPADDTAPCVDDDWFVPLKALSGLDGFAVTVMALLNRANRENWERRPKRIGRALFYEYSVASMPAATQQLVRRQLRQGFETPPRDRQVVHISGVYLNGGGAL